LTTGFAAQLRSATTCLIVAVSLITGLVGEVEAQSRRAEEKKTPLGIAASGDGTIGLVRLGSAIVAPKGSFSVLGTMDFWTQDEFMAPGIDQRRLDNGTAVSVSLADVFEIYVSGRASSHIIDDTIIDDRTLAQSIGDIAIGTKLAYPIKDFFWLGGDATVFFRTDRGGLGPDFSATSYRGRLLTSSPSA